MRAKSITSVGKWGRTETFDQELYLLITLALLQLATAKCSREDVVFEFLAEHTKPASAFCSALLRTAGPLSMPLPLLAIAASRLQSDVSELNVGNILL
jgi:hypothetical protein